VELVGLEGGVAVLQVDVVELVGQRGVEVVGELIAGADLVHLVVELAVVVADVVERRPLVADDAVDGDHRRVEVDDRRSELPGE
jgi:hypothetical protein